MSKLGFWIVTALTFALMLAALELNRNTLWGFALLILLTAAYVFVQYKLEVGGFVRFLLWLAFVALFIGILFLTWPPTKRVPAVQGKSPKVTDTVEVSGGLIRGVCTEDGAVEVYAGIPYAKPPVCELRWKEPQPADRWEGVLEADSFAPMSMQPVNIPLYDSLRQIIGYHDYKISLKDNYVAPVSEDSLYLNIWKPAGEAEGLPVLVYIHGGSLQTGQPWYEDYSGESLARQGVIVVNMGYRLGAFGFLTNEEAAAESENGTTGNYGLLDQIMALKWVRDNISAFGGDPANVTLSGESAGSACVSALCTSKRAEGLFRRAVMESSTVASAEPPHSFRLFGEAIKSGKELMERYGCASLEELRALPAEKLVNEAYSQHHITVDGYVLSELPYESYRKGEYNGEAILHGYNSRESGPFLIFANANKKNYENKVRAAFGEYADEVLKLYPAQTNDEAKEAWAQMWGALFFDYPHYCLDRLAGENGLPCYEYTFSKDNGRLGAWHSGEEVYLYGNIPADSKLYDSRDRELSDQMLAYFVNFIKTGDPNGAGLPLWTDDGAGAELMGFGDATGMASEKKLALFAVIDKMTGWSEP